MVSVPACGSSGPSSNLTGSINFISSIKYLEMFRDIRSERREGVAWGVSRNVPRSVSCSFNAYIGTPISNCSYVYSFLAVTFPSISRKVARYLGQCITGRYKNTKKTLSIRLSSLKLFCIQWAPKVYPFFPKIEIF